MNLEKHIASLNKASAAIKAAKDDQKRLFKVIGKELRQARKDRNIKGVTVSRATRITQPNLYFIEMGEALIDEARLRKIWKAIVKIGGR